MELYRRYRPSELSGLYGQDAAVKSLAKMIKNKNVPHAIALIGSSGCGKTTSAYILMRHLGCDDADFVEINCADFRGIDTIRSIRETVRLRPLAGNARVWLLDEVGKLTSDSQTAMLKMLEDPPDHAYYILATTEPNKLIPTLRSRCTEIVFRPLDDAMLEKLIKEVAKREKAKVSDELIDRIIAYAQGSARKALVALEQALALDTDAERLAAIVPPEAEAQVFEICRILMCQGAKWPGVAKVLKTVKEDPETIRRMVLGYFNTVLLGGKNAARAAQVINCLRDATYDGGKAVLSLMLYEASQG